MSLSHPLWVRGLKLKCAEIIDKEVESHPLWVRGLKHPQSIFHMAKGKSHPLWVRGLKQWICVCHLEFAIVAPLVGAWIETLLRGHGHALSGRTPCGCVD